MKRLPNLFAFALINILLLAQGLMAQEVQKDPHPGKFYTVEKSYGDSAVDGYNLYIPNTYSTNSKPFPLIVFFQGGLGVGGKVDALFNWELPKELKEAKPSGAELKELKFNTFIYVMPHIAKGEYFENTEAIKEVIAEVSQKYQVDKQRIYLTGLSRGGHGTWGVASKTPEIFAAIAPICGADYGISNYTNLTKIPIFTAHNIADDRVAYTFTQDIVAKIEAVSGKKFFRTNTVAAVDYKNNDLIFVSAEGEKKGHNAWREVYNDVNFYKWLLRFRKN